MATPLRLPVAGDRCEALFPERCMGCGAPPTTRTAMRLSRLVARRRRRQGVASVELAVPHCARCARLSAWSFNLGLIAGLLGFVLLGGLAFLAAAYGAIWLRLDEYGNPNQSPALVLGAAAGLAGGLLGALLAEAIARVLLLPLLGREALRAPLLVAQLLADSEYVAGVSGRLSADGLAVELQIADPRAAQAFADLNRERLL